MTESETVIRNNWEELNQEIESICSQLGRKSPLIIAVSKTRTIEEIEIAYDVGIRHFGENYAQELEEKAQMLPNAKWHFIGHLQRSNVRKVIPYANYFHTLDSIKLTNKITTRGYNGESLIQVKISEDLSKHGVENDRESIEKLYNYATKNGLKITGIMGIGGLSWNDEKIKQEFLNLKNIKDELNLKELSLGMSGDYKIAIESGSTMLRIGTRIFGKRL